MQRIRKGITDLKEQGIYVCQMGLDAKSIRERLSDANWNGLTILIGLNIDRTAFLASYVSRNIKLAFICGGTDVYECVKDSAKLQRMTEVISKSSAIVAFGASLQRQFLSFWPDYKGLLRIIPQSVCVNEPNQIYCKSIISSLESKLAVSLENFILFAGRLRPVKDPAYSLKPFLSIAESRRELHLQLLFVGSVVSDSSFILIRLFPGRILQGNSRLPSRSPTAMALGCPVVARRIPGNADLIEHAKTGLLFDSQKELKECLESLLDDNDLRNLISRNARKKSQDTFQYHNEAKSYLNLIDEIRGQNI
ncbi:unnamed protein product [Hymenolepis diminuta]|uniref:Glycos_transf_1 domain-containing protein n=1 Tax=Hymenolepis diminuta TaxID=6216 RepID=A0A0R3SPW2_HYMDI|nr:unnamed protein product [Hymenolepis diminuta]